jgi:predicted 2-oxoglutarate/Fe(II)-dependent dioxygenase YbiX
MTADILVIPGAFSADVCRRIRAAMDAGESAEAEIIDGEITVDVDVRQALDVTIAEPILTEVEDRLEQLRAPVSAFFDLAINGAVGVTCLRYSEGGHYLRHRDRDPTPGSGTEHRRLSVIVWLNSGTSAKQKGEFEGGALHVFAPGRDTPREFIPLSGTLLAFPSDWVHEVMPVSRGRRDVVVDWWLAY